MCPEHPTVYRARATLSETRAHPVGRTGLRVRYVLPSEGSYVNSSLYRVWGVTAWSILLTTPLCRRGGHTTVTVTKPSSKHRALARLFHAGAGRRRLPARRRPRHPSLGDTLVELCAHCTYRCKLVLGRFCHCSTKYISVAVYEHYTANGRSG